MRRQPGDLGVEGDHDAGMGERLCLEAVVALAGEGDVHGR